MLNPTCTVFTCMLLFTKHNYKAKKLNYLTLKLSTQREQHILVCTLSYVYTVKISL
jgi:hypothetical protein